MTPRRTLPTVIVLVLGAVVATPLVWLVTGAFGLPDGLTLRGFAALFRGWPMLPWLLNGMVIAGGQTLLAVLICSAAAFALSCYDFTGRRIVIALLVAAAVLPSPAVVTGLFATVASIGGVDTYWAATLPGVFSGFGVLVYFASMRSLPASLLQAGRLDGAREWRLWWHLALPALRPTTSVFALLHFLAAWNAILWPAAVLASDAKRPIAVGLSEARTSRAFEGDPTLPLSATLIALVPVAVLFAVASRDLLRSRRAD
ncbi:MAG: carbohydrate ABC transporter permease [Planctomycetota bacterium]